MQKAKTIRTNSGYSLPELMVVVAIIAIAAGIAVPNFLNWRDNAQLGRAARELYSSFQKAKMTAARNSQYCTVAFQQIANGTLYDYVVFVDENRNLVWNAGEQVISGALWSNYGSVSFDADFESGTGIGFTGAVMAFAPDGLPRDNANNLQSGTVYLRNKSNKKRSIAVNLAGYIRIN